MNTLSDLIARVEASSGPDRELDAEIACWAYGLTVHEDSDPSDGSFAAWCGEPWKSECTNISDWPRYSESIDAAVALASRVLPGWRGLVRFGEWPDHDNELRAALWDNDLAKRENVFGISSNAATPALALVAAVLKAVQAQREAA